MSSVISTNVASLNAQRNLGTSQTSLATSLQRLSSSMRINSAKDDAAGLAISQRMTSQINWPFSHPMQRTPPAIAKPSRPKSVS